MLLAGDIGGTKTLLALFSPDGGPFRPVAERTFRSSDYSSFETMVAEFLSSVTEPVSHGSFGVAGPVAEGAVNTTNLPWVIEEKSLAGAVGLKAAFLLNDLEAVAYAIPHLEPDDLHVLNEGRPVRGGAMAIIAPGTGLGEAFLVWTDRGYRACPSEGGHTDFSPATAREVSMLQYLQARYDHVSWEHVCSGIGITNIYSFLRDTGAAEEPPWLAAELKRAGDANPVIIENGLRNPDKCEICRLTLETFVSLLGRESGNLALKVLATGGVYLGGGIPPRILPALEGGPFLEAFRGKGRMTHLVNRIPVKVIVNEKAALLGAACYGLERMGG